MFLRGPAGPPGTCVVLTTSLSCRVFNTARSAGPRARAALYHGAVRVAGSTTRVARGKVVSLSLRPTRRVAAGRYVLVLTRGGRRLLRTVVTVRS